MNELLAPQPVVLALSGGGGRSFLQVGALQALEDAGFSVAGVTGCSSGAILGAALAAGLNGQALERALASADVTGWLHLQLGSGLVNQEGLRRWLEKTVPPCFEDLQLPFAAVTTDLQTGDEVIFRSGPLVEPVLASSAFTGAVYPRRVAGRWLTDGGLVNELPADLAREMAAELGGLPVIALDVTSPLKALSFERTSGLIGAAEALIKGDSPLVAEVLRQAFIITQNRVTKKRLELSPPDWLVPFKEIEEIDVLDLGDLSRGVQLGYGVMQRFLEAAAQGKPAAPAAEDQLGGRIFARAAEEDGGSSEADTVS